MFKQNNPGCTAGECACGGACCIVGDDCGFGQQGGVCCRDVFERDEGSSVGSDYEEIAGDWALEIITPDEATSDLVVCDTPALVTDDDGAILLLTREMPGGNAHYASLEFMTRKGGHVPSAYAVAKIGGLRFRWMWAWEDDDNYWCVEYRYDADFDSTRIGIDFDDPNSGDWVKLIERSGGSETVHAEVLNGWMRESDVSLIAGGPGPDCNDFCYQSYHCATTAVSVRVDAAGRVMARGDWSGFRSVSPPYTGHSSWFLCDDTEREYAAGRMGIKVMDCPDGIVIGCLQVCCVEGDNDCEPALVVEPCDEEEPVGCCDCADLGPGAAIEVTVSGITYYTGGTCLDDCTEIDTPYLDALNGTFTIPLISFRPDRLVFAGLIGIDNPCDPAGGEFGIAIEIRRVDDTDCQAFGLLGNASCGWTFTGAPFTDGFSCSGKTVTVDDSTSAFGCCLGAGAATLDWVMV